MKLVDTESRARLEKTVFVEGHDERLVHGDPVAESAREMLLALGEDVERPGLQRTPERVARMYRELLAGYNMDAGSLINGALFPTEYEGIVLVKDIEFSSLCEHHLLPFFGRAHVAYLPDRQVVGLSKIPRIVDMYARRLQLQEQLTEQIATCLMDALQPKGVAVVVEGVHACMMIRGVHKAGARMVTRTLLGAFKDDAALKHDLEVQMGPVGNATLV